MHNFDPLLMAFYIYLKKKLGSEEIILRSDWQETGKKEEILNNILRNFDSLVGTRLGLNWSGSYLDAFVAFFKCSVLGRKFFVFVKKKF